MKKVVETRWDRRVKRWKSFYGRLEIMAPSNGFAHKDDAVFYGREWAQKVQCEHVIKNKDGKIGKRNSYGNDPRSRRG